MTVPANLEYVDYEHKIKLARGPYVVIAAVIWEFFSYFGMCSLLILYLTQSLHLPDKYAYSLYGAYSSLTYLTPIVGGFAADTYFGNRISMILGAALIMLGHFTLAFSTMWSLYLGLSLLICGVGFFKASAICLIGEYYPDINERNSAFMLYYMGGNIGATIAPLICGYVAAKFGWEYGFAAAGIGMFLGLITLFLFRKYLRGMGEPKVKLYSVTHGLNTKFISISLLLILIFIALTNCVIIELWSGFIIVAATMIALFIVGKFYLKSSAKTRSGLNFAAILTLFGMLFWIFVQQGGSSISLFIERFINRSIALPFAGNVLIPTPMFQSINPASIVIFGGVIALILKKIAKTKLAFDSTSQILLGVILLVIGFVLIAFSSSISSETVKASMWWVIIGLTLLSTAEIFIDPVILGVITKVAPEKALSTFTAIYYLFVGAIANYLAAQVAKLTSAPTEKAAISLYTHTYTEIVYVGIAMLIGLVILKFVLIPYSSDKN